MTSGRRKSPPRTDETAQSINGISAARVNANIASPFLSVALHPAKSLVRKQKILILEKLLLVNTQTIFLNLIFRPCPRSIISGKSRKCSQKRSFPLNKIKNFWTFLRLQK